MSGKHFNMCNIGASFLVYSIYWGNWILSSSNSFIGNSSFYNLVRFSTGRYVYRKIHFDPFPCKLAVKCVYTMLQKHRCARHTASQQHAVLVTRAPCAFWSNPGGLVIDSSSWVNTPFLLFLFNLKTLGWIFWPSKCSQPVSLYTFGKTSVFCP